ncbi:TPA: Rpn family recombination-promoting nuclease/putative transposase [Salmonella enterica subsp. enterica]|nr:Rpn family recombination-promoting nuclease/putative transposase [Salmonella enterica]
MSDSSRKVFNHKLSQASESANSEAFVRELAQRVPLHGDALMTIAQQIEQKGIWKGREQGKPEGERESTLKIARKMLKNGLDLTSVMKMTDLTADELEQTRH